MTLRAVIRHSALTVTLALTVSSTSTSSVRLVEWTAPGVIGLTAGRSSTPKPADVSPASRARIRNTLADLPLAFEPNRGQSAAEVKFLTRAPGYLLQLTATEVRMIVTGAPAKPARGTRASAERPSDETAAPSHALTFTWRNANPRAEAAPESALPGIVNYLKGSDPAQWHTGIPTFARVRYVGIYPGIDVTYYGTGRQLEYDLIVAPHAHPEAARLVLEGAGATLTGNGDLALALTSGRSLRFRPPVAYQERAGQRVPVEAGYRLSASAAGTEVSFDLAAYDPELPLVIDPLVYSTFLGGSSDDAGNGIAVNAANEAYVTGYTLDAGIDFPVTNGAFDAVHNGSTDVFVTRVNSTGTALVYSTFLGGSSGDTGTDIAVNALDEAFVTGDTIDAATDFPTTVGAFDTTHNGLRDVFVTRLNSTGTALVYSTLLGGSSDEWGEGIAVNAGSEAFVTGYTFDAVTDFPTTGGAFDSTHNGAYDVFVTRVNGAGTALVYSTFLGGTGEDAGRDIAVNGNEAFVIGQTADAVTDFPTTVGAFDTSHNGALDVFVSRLNGAGTALLYSTFLGSGSFDRGYGIAVNGAGEAFATGEAADVDFPVTVGAFDTSLNGAYDAFVTRLNSAGSALIYSTFIGGAAFDGGFDIAVSAANDAFVTGYTDIATPAFPTTGGAFDTGHNGGADAFVTRLNSAGSALLYSTFLGGSGLDRGHGIAVNAANEAFVTGSTFDAATDFPTTVGAYDTGHNFGEDAFVARVATSGPQPPTNLRVTGMAGNVVTFGWIPPAVGPIPTGFQIEGGLVPGQVVGALPLGPAPSVTITLPSGSFYLRVRTLGGSATSAVSNEVLVHVNVAVTPSAPANLLGLVVGDTLDLAWTNTFGGGAPTNVILDVSGALSGSAPLGLTDTFSFAGVPPGTYTLSVRATNAVGSSVASNPVTLTFPGGCIGAPLPVTSFVAYNVGGMMFLNWETAASGPAPTGYALIVTGSFVGTLPTPVKALSGAVPAGTYNVSVVAGNACGTSGPTPVQTVTMP